MTKTKTQKARSKMERKVAAQVRKPVAKPKGRKKKWHFALGTQWGSVSMGSGDKAQQMNTRKIRDVYDMQMAPNPTTVDRGGASTKQVIRQKELVDTITADVFFQCRPFLLQPGLADNFPWLSKIASLYQRYKFKYLRFFYVPTVSQFSDMGKQGRIVLCCDYDAVAPNCQTLVQAEGLNPNCPGIPYQTLSLVLNNDRLTPGTSGKFVRSGLPPAGTDLKTYDAGMLMVCTDGSAIAGPIGELHVEYEVELMDPILPNTAPPAKAIMASQATLAAANLSSAVNTTYVVDGWGGTVLNGLALTLGPSGGIVFPEGTFQITFVPEITFSIGASGVRNYIAIGSNVIGASRTGFTSADITTHALPATTVWTMPPGTEVTFGTYAVFPSGLGTLSVGGSSVQISLV